MQNRRLFLLFVVFILVLLAVQPAVTFGQSEAYSSTAGFGAAFAYAQNIGSIAYTQAGSIGNGDALAISVTPFSAALSEVWSGGNAAAYSQAIGTPFGTVATTQVVSFFDGFAAAAALAHP